ncbi:hypothetical protein GUJ93_ZPchr0013g35417 [Zizania palustris]|uniref:Bifunctional inhibitor/plant lipid transfer protein/seed storage helical domain-containing protein n=1 Tax=Zizania palustris TaxID=103762 RepID=A0A8J6BYN3_ZIZPA|nr:hypothetical protein GUJ93_ZPchr0013g35417 [Zizania palustris]
MAASALHAAAVVAVLVLPSFFATVAAQGKAKAFCISQFAIASQACSILPPSPPEEHDDDDDDDHGGGDDDGDNGGGDREHHRDHRGRRRGHAVVDFSALVASSNDADGHGAAVGNGTGHHGNRTRGGHGRRRRGRGRRGRLRDDHGDDDDDHGGDDGGGGDDDDDDDEHRAYRDCCRWLQEVSKDCVCDALLRLPPFLVKPQHTYVVRVGRTCQITYRCGGV